MTQQKDQMKISVLASGSSGNVTYVETEKHKVLIDAGLSGKKIETLMNSIGRTINSALQLSRIGGGRSLSRSRCLGQALRDERVRK